MRFSSELWPQDRGWGQGCGVVQGSRWCRTEERTRKNAHFSHASPGETETVETVVKFLRMKGENTSFRN